MIGTIARQIFHWASKTNIRRNPSFIFGDDSYTKIWPLHGVFFTRSTQGTSNEPLLLSYICGQEHTGTTEQGKVVPVHALTACGDVEV